METSRRVRIVVASPSDVRRERDLLPTIVDEINRGIAADRGLRLELSRWETDSYPGFHVAGPQGLIDPVLRIADCDVFIGIFWRRFGTPSMDAESGTEHEILLAYQAWKDTGKPQIMVYFNEAHSFFKSEEEKAQYQKLLAFRSRFPKEGLFWSYQGKAEFERLVRNHLTQFIRQEYPRSTAVESIHQTDAGRPLEELLQVYADNLKARLSRLYIIGASDVRELEKVFVKLSITAEYKRPSSHLKFLGLMDAEMRRRRDVFGDLSDEEETDNSGSLIEPDALIRQGTQAVITGAPGSGKTTLLKYLALQGIAEGARLVIYVELKGLTESHFSEARNDLVELLFERGVTTALRLKSDERNRLKAHYLACLAAGEAALYLDGLDEIRSASFFPILRSAVSEFVRSEYRKNTLVISTRPYALQTRLEGLNEMEIAPLNQQQIEEFLKHYYGDDVAIKTLLHQLRRNNAVRELCRVPFLLSVVAQLHKTEHQIINNQLEIYRQIVVYLGSKLDKEKSLLLSGFHIVDPDGTLKLDFLKELACERLLRGFVNDEEVTEEASRLIFSGNILTEHAKRFLEKEKRPEINPRWLAADVKATPLLREVGNDIYAFVHLTIQEYLAAVALSIRDDCTDVYCRAYFNTSLSSMEVLPMTLGLVHQPDALYEALSSLPESLTWSNYRLSARALSYAPELVARVREPLTQRLVDFAIERHAEETPYANAVLNSFALSSPFVTESIAALLQSTDVKTRMSVVEALGHIGGETAVKYLCIAANDPKSGVRWLAVEALGMIGDDSAEATLIRALKDDDELVRRAAAEALSLVGGPAAIDGLLEVLTDAFVHVAAAEALARIGGTRARDSLLGLLRDRDANIRRDAAKALRWTKTDAARRAVEEALTDSHSSVRANAAGALGRIGSDESVTRLAPLLHDVDEYVRSKAAWALGDIGSNKAVVVLVEALRSADEVTRWSAGQALTGIRSAGAVDAAAELLRDSSFEVRYRVAMEFAKIGDTRATDALIEGLKTGDSEVRWRVAARMSHLREENFVPVLIEALRDESHSVRYMAASALAHDGAKSAYDALIHSLNDEDGGVRALAAYALGHIGDKRSLSVLIGATQDEDEHARRRAFEALGQLRELETVGAILKGLADEISTVRASAAQALEQFGNSELAAGLKQALSHEAPFVRRKAAQCIGYYAQDLDVFDSLTRLAENDPLSEVRRTAWAERSKYGRKLRLFGL